MALSTRRSESGTASMAGTPIAYEGVKGFRQPKI